MKFTLSWLKEYLDTTASLEQICDTLTMIGLEVEVVTDMAAMLAPFIVAEVREASPHPDADKLNICKVFDGSEELQIICGAPNARAGIKVALARIGTVIPTNDLKIKRAKIRGIESCGMLCSSRELGIGEDHDGIIELPEACKTGEPFAPQIGLDDPMIEIAITPDRADCLGVYGIARDLAAAGLGTLKPLDVPTIAENGASTITVSLGDGNHGCRQFIGRTIRGVTNGPSPDWLQQRLKAIGLRPISALVDVTNYISVAYGRPLHVYDIAKLTGNIHVRRSNAGEQINALNDKSYQLEAGATVIADDAGPLGFGGIVGGEESGCTETTTDTFLEIAYFDPIDIALTGRKYQIDSDARYRFERGVDPAFLPDAAAIATAMILELCGGEASELVIAGESAYQPRQITFRPSRTETLGGIAVPEAEQERIIQTLGFAIDNKSNDRWQLTVPSWRGDVHGEADVVEEVLRIHGFDHLPATSLPAPDATSITEIPLAARRADNVRHQLASIGMHEVMSWSFMPEAQAAAFGGGSNALKLLNPISSELGMMRPTPLPNLLSMAATNHARGQEAIALFEVGLGYQDISATGQQMLAVGIRSGKASAHPHQPAAAPSLFDTKADAIAALEAAGAPVANLKPSREAPAYFHPGRSGALKLGKQVIGYFGEIHPAILSEFDLDGPVAAFELFLDAIPQPKGKSGFTRPAYQPSGLQPVKRDFSFFLTEDMMVADLLNAVATADRKRITQVDLISLYQDEAMKEQGERSVALRITIQPREQTLTEAELDAISEQVLLAALKVKGCRLSDALKHYASDKQLDAVLKAA